MDKHIKLNIQYDLQEFRSYYQTLVDDHQNRLWEVFAQEENILPHRFGTSKEHLPVGFAIQSYTKPGDNTLPAPWNVTTDDISDGRTTTELIFGVAERLLEKIPLAFRLSISIMRPGGFIASHPDTYWHVHFPLYSPDGSIFTFDDNDGNIIDSVHYNEGECWAINTLIDHSVFNNGNSDRVHMYFSIKEEDIPALIELTKNGLII